MPFRASSSVPDQAYRQAKLGAAQLKANLLAINAALSSQNVSLDYVRDVVLVLSRADGQFASLAAVPGIAEYAQAQEGDVTYDVAAAFADMRTAIAAALAWVSSAVPATGSIKPVAEWDDGSLLSDTFTPAQTAGLRTALTAVIAEIS